MTRLSPRERKLLGWAGAALALYLLLDFAVLPWWDTLGETRAAAGIQARRVRNYRRILQQRDRTRSELARLRQRTRSLEQGLLDSSGDALAGAEIQGLVRDIAAAHGLTVQNSDLVPMEPLGPRYSKVSTRVGLQGGIHKFVEFMAALGSGPRILFVEDLRIAPVRINRPEDKDIRVTLAIAGIKPVEPENAADSPGSTEAPGAGRGRGRQ
ncbi:MAG: type II secretion system protein GspM [Acidobacteriota bacterium]|nr:type II secretion system protein GspM [Acidobacteriota bacterium]MDE2963931.1 type II secretion system protein GspM [Acidobacteriota bacterium]